ncbi:UTP:RNA uridylyltransferase 1 [Salvia miltiorrhiza]|uniref:UTP:RNA uridylyltransferase 1 n=1 Tax=Salvia miltiorrhiza TaxID=226208 RepID=UPI0025AD05A5|nr:UTP:RNA uridylyltransferase 1 [Salvia miltiorrhiza]
MSGRGGDAPLPNGGEFLLQLLRKQSNSGHPIFPPQPQQQQQQQTFSQDPAVAAVGPTIPTFPHPHAAFPPSNGGDFAFPPWGLLPPPPFAQQNYFQQNPNPNPNFSSPSRGYAHSPPQFDLQSRRISPGDDARNLGFYGDNSKPSAANQPGQNLIFGSLNRDVLQNGAVNALDPSLFRRPENRFPPNSIEANENSRGNHTVLRAQKLERSSNSNDNVQQGDSGRVAVPPPGFLSDLKNVRQIEHGYGRRAPDLNGDKGKGNAGHSYKSDRLSYQLDFLGFPVGSSLQSASNFDIEESMKELFPREGEEFTGGVEEKLHNDGSEMDVLEDLVDSLGIEDQSGEKNGKKKLHRDKDYRSDNRGKWIMGQRMRTLKRQTTCRNDINMLNAPLLALFESLIPSDEEKLKQKQLLTLLENLVRKEWPNAHLFLYGSCANSFGFSKSDVDVCLQMDLGDVEKSEVLLKLAKIFESDNLQNVQALTRARVPIVKLMDPVTGISCDICINNVLAVVNTKLLHDYARIDVRLRQLAFIVKHWAKSRGVNVTYQGTLSSYAYVLMCIHFLQQRRPSILPCLQRMQITYFVTVDDIECAYFDQVDKLQNFGAQNGESIAQLVWAFFHYWAYCHDYANDVISVRTGSMLSKRGKDWTRRVGNDRHLICIEDPFEVSHDLGRVVDKFSIRVLREEFERAAEIMQYDPKPCVTLFEPYIPN